MKKIFQKYKIQIVGIAFIFIMLPIFYFSTIFLLNGIKNKADEIQKRIIDNNLENQKIEKIPQMEKVNAGFERNKDAVGVILYPGESVNFIKNLENLADETGNKITIAMLDNGTKNINPNLAVESDVPNKNKIGDKSLEDKLAYRNYLKMRIDLVGDYSGLLKFMHKLENSQNYVNIIAVSAKEGFEDKNTLLQTTNLNVGDIFQSSQTPTANPPSEPKKILKTALTIIVYME
jgi:hypothetical protein